MHEPKPSKAAKQNKNPSLFCTRFRFSEGLVPSMAEADAQFTSHIRALIHFPSRYDEISHLFCDQNHRLRVRFLATLFFEF